MIISAVFNYCIETLNCVASDKDTCFKIIIVSTKHVKLDNWNQVTRIYYRFANFNSSTSSLSSSLANNKSSKEMSDLIKRKIDKIPRNLLDTYIVCSMMINKTSFSYHDTLNRSNHNEFPLALSKSFLRNKSVPHKAKLMTEIRNVLLELLSPKFGSNLNLTVYLADHLTDSFVLSSLTNGVNVDLSLQIDDKSM